MKNRSIIVWRHGRTPWNVARRVQGSTDIDLDDVGKQQAYDASARLASLAPAVIVSSDLRRAADTAGALARRTGHEVALDARFRELSFGVREGLTTRQAWDKYPALMKQWRGSPRYRFPGAETAVEAAERFASGLHDVIAELDRGQTAVVVTHGGVARVGVCQFLGLPEELWHTIGGLNNCSWSVLSEWQMGRETQWRMTEWNAGELPEPALSDDSDPFGQAQG